jgi:hypothetical protein
MGGRFPGFGHPALKKATTIVSAAESNSILLVSTYSSSGSILNLRSIGLTPSGSICSLMVRRIMSPRIFRLFPVMKKVAAESNSNMRCEPSSRKAMRPDVSRALSVGSLTFVVGLTLSKSTTRVPASSRDARCFFISSGSAEYGVVAACCPYQILLMHLTSLVLPDPGRGASMANRGTPSSKRCRRPVVRMAATNAVRDTCPSTHLNSSNGCSR